MKFKKLLSLIASFFSSDIKPEASSSVIIVVEPEGSDGTGLEAMFPDTISVLATFLNVVHNADFT